MLETTGLRFIIPLDWQPQAFTPGANIFTQNMQAVFAKRAISTGAVKSRFKTGDYHSYREDIVALIAPVA